LPETLGVNVSISFSVGALRPLALGARISGIQASACAATACDHVCHAVGGSLGQAEETQSASLQKGNSDEPYQANKADDQSVLDYGLGVFTIRGS